jgi:hypothetical protein
MKAQIFFLVLLITAGCSKSGRDTTAGDPVDDESNQAMYDKVMDIHDEVMPKMDDLYNIKRTLQESITETTELPEDKRKEIELVIAEIEAANEGMMVWMREFDPPMDSASEEELRDYLEEQMVKVKKVREDILGALERGKEFEKYKLD